jgi:steroid 5-alpha reductase family enzyme
VIQNVLLLLIATPVLIAATHPSPLTPTDGILTLSALALLAWEFTADNQQFAFHAWKHGTYDARAHWPGARLAWTKDDAARGFCTRGLWSWSRHPNFFAEQAFWVCAFALYLCPPRCLLLFIHKILSPANQQRACSTSSLFSPCRVHYRWSPRTKARSPMRFAS